MMTFFLLLALWLGEPHSLTLQHATLEPSHASGALYRAGDTVRIVADPAPQGQHFVGWVSDPKLTLMPSEHVAFAMPDAHVTVTALYR